MSFLLCYKITQVALKANERINKLNFPVVQKHRRYTKGCKAQWCGSNWSGPGSAQDLYLKTVHLLLFSSVLLRFGILLVDNTELQCWVSDHAHSFLHPFISLQCSVILTLKSEGLILKFSRVSKVTPAALKSQ